MIILTTALAISAIALGLFVLRVLCDRIALAIKNSLVIRKHRKAITPQAVAQLTVLFYQFPRLHTVP